MKPIAHGTNRGYAAHGRRNELACRPCLDAHAAASRGGTPPRQLIPCPSEAAYQRHRRNDEDACDACKAAHATYESDQAQLRKVRAA